MAIAVQNKKYLMRSGRMVCLVNLKPDQLVADYYYSTSQVIPGEPIPFSQRCFLRRRINHADNIQHQHRAYANGET